MRMLPWPVWPLAGQARWGQNMNVGSMTVLLSWRCWGACQEGVCLDPHFYSKCTSPRFSGELPDELRWEIYDIFENTTALVPGTVGRRCSRANDPSMPHYFDLFPIHSYG